MTHSLRWGILGTGGIAKKFAGQIQHVSHADLVAVASRTQASADAFTAEYGGKAYAGYENLLADDQVEAVYVSLPNALHCEWTVRALEAGKHVLCEKPLASNTTEAEQMFAAAEKHDRTLVEAFMYRCQPAVQKFIEMARSGAVGEIRIIRSHFTFNRSPDPTDVRYQTDLAGGALMDVGSYPINFARAIAGSEPTAMQALMHWFETGVDSYTVGSLQFGEGPLCAFTCGMCVTSDRTTYVGGSEGYLAIDMPWMSDGTFRLVREGQEQLFTEQQYDDQYALEAKVFAEVVQGAAEPWISREDSLGNMRVLDQLRQQAL
jgi:predicted dehydrogenase